MSKLYITETKKGKIFMTKLKEARKAKGLTQLDLSQKIGVHTTSICNMERKGITDIRTAQKYAAGLECNPFFLLENMTNPVK